MLISGKVCVTKLVCYATTEQAGWGVYAARRIRTSKCRDAACAVSERLDAAGLFLVAVAVTAHEFVDATGGIDKFLLAGEEWVRRAGDFELNQRICSTIYIDSFFGGYCRAGDEDFVVGHIFEHHFAVIGGMYAFFHLYRMLKIIRLWVYTD